VKLSYKSCNKGKKWIDTGMSNSRSVIRKGGTIGLVSRTVVVHFVNKVCWPPQEWVCGLQWLCFRNLEYLDRGMDVVLLCFVVLCFVFLCCVSFCCVVLCFLCCVSFCCVFFVFCFVVLCCVLFPCGWII